MLINWLFFSLSMHIQNLIKLMNSRNSQNKFRDEILNKIPIFLAKTYRIVDNPAYMDIIGWSNEGDAFIIKDIPRLTTEVFPQHFKHNNFLSFVRQLNMYGFHKIASTSDTVGQIFKHQCFRRDLCQQLLQIKRKIAVDEGESQQIVAIAGRQQQLQREAALLRRQHKQLQNMMQILIEQNKTIAAQNKAFAHMMAQMRQKYRKKLQTLMLLLFFGQKNHNNDFIFPQKFSHIFEAFQKMNHDDTPVYILPKKQARNKKNNFPMIAARQRTHFYSDSDWERSQVYSQSDKVEKQEYEGYLKRQKPSRKRLSYKEEQEKLEVRSESQWKQGIPISPYSALSKSQFDQQAEWNDYLNGLQYLDYSQPNLEKQQ